MRRVGFIACLGTAALLGGCGTMSKSAEYTSKGAGAASSAASDTYDGIGGAVQAPMRDLNLVHDNVPPVLVRAYARPYDTTGLDTCEGITQQVGLLDLALGPDVDIPRAATPEKDMFAKGAGMAADAALDAAKSATTGVIPLRSWVRRFSGANRAEQEAKAVALAGSVRRGYLKAIGQVKGCDWPAAPLNAGITRARLAPPDPASPATALDTANRAAIASASTQPSPPAKGPPSQK